MHQEYITKERISSTLLNSGRSFRQMSDEFPLSRATIMKVIDKKNYTFETYEKVISYCRKLAPNEDWSYISLKELALFYATHIPPRNAIVSPIMRNNFVSGNHVPKVDNYIILCNCKSQMEASDQCLE